MNVDAALDRQHRDVLALAARGLTDAAIAEHLCWSEELVAHVLADAARRLGVAALPERDPRLLAVIAYVRASGEELGAAGAIPPA